MATSRPDSVEDEIEKLRGQMPRKEEMKLVQNRTSLRQTIMKRAIEDSGVEAGDELTQWWLPEQGLVVIDMESSHE